jgi:ATP-dependent DNA ligase
MGYKEGQNGFTGMVGAIVFGQYDETGALTERGRCSGMDLATRREISENRDGFLGSVIEVAHHGVIKNKLRHPQFKRFRPDKNAEQVLIHNA